MVFAIFLFLGRSSGIEYTLSYEDESETKLIEISKGAEVVWIPAQVKEFLNAPDPAYSMTAECKTTLKHVFFEAMSCLEVLGNYCFNSCKALLNITIPARVEYIGSYCFSGCSALNSIVFENRGPNIVSFGIYLFYGTSSLREMELPSKITLIPGCCFQGSGIRNISLPDSLTAINGWAFANSHITTLAPSEQSQLTSIGSLAFSRCYWLVSIHIPPLFQSFQFSAFDGCTSLAVITCSTSHASFYVQDNVLYGNQTLIMVAPNACTAEFTIPGDIIGVSSVAFNSCLALHKIVISENVTTICESAFSQANNLQFIEVDPLNPHFKVENGILFNKEMTDLVVGVRKEGSPDLYIPSTVTRVSSSALEACATLITVTFVESGDETNQIIGQAAFHHCDSLSQVILSSRISSIAYWGFKRCSNLISVHFPENIRFTKFSESFNQCFKLKSIRIPRSVTVIGGRAFLECGLETLFIPNSVQRIDLLACQYCDQLLNVTFEEGSGVTVLSNGVFSKCSSLQKIVFPSSLTSIGMSCFYECSNLIFDKLPDTVTTIDTSAFYGCSSLTSFSFPHRVTKISPIVLSGCTSLTRVSIPGSVSSIYNSAFQGCNAIQEFVVDESNAHFKSESGVIYNKAMTHLYSFPCGNSSIYFNIPDSVTHILSSAFSGAGTLKRINVPPSVVSVGNNAFYGCNGLEHCGLNHTQETSLFKDSGAPDHALLPCIYTNTFAHECAVSFVSYFMLTYSLLLH